MLSQYPGLISQTQTEEKAKYSVVIRKISQLISTLDKLYGKSNHKKLIQTDYNTLKLTSFPSVIFDNIRINHPIVKLLIEYTKKLETLGDSCKYFLLLVRNIVQESNKIVEKGVKPTMLSEIYRNIGSSINEYTKQFVCDMNVITNQEAFDNSNISTQLNKMGLNTINMSCLLSSLVQDETIKELLVCAIAQTKSFSTEKIRICKIPTGSVQDSYVIEGMVFDRIAEGTVKSIVDGSTAIYNCSLDICKAELKSTVSFNNSTELYNFSADEVSHIREKVNELNSDVIICSGSVNNIFLDFCNMNNKLVFKIQSKHDVRRIRECVNGYISPVLEQLKQHDLGTVKEVCVFKEGARQYTKFIGNEIRTLVLKGPLDVVLDEHERVVNKALRALSKHIKNNTVSVVQGSGVFESQVAGVFKQMTASSFELKYAYESLRKAFDKFQVCDTGIYDIYSTKLTAIKYALDFVAIMYETDDYLIGIQEKLNIKPRMNEDWDEDH